MGQHRACVSSLWGQRDLFSVQPKAEGRERGHSRSAGGGWRMRERLGILSHVFCICATSRFIRATTNASIRWPVGVDFKRRKADLLPVGAEPVDQVPKAAETGEARCPGGARRVQCDMVDALPDRRLSANALRGLNGRSPRRRQGFSTFERAGRLQQRGAWHQD